MPALTYRGDSLDLWQFVPDRPWNAIGATRADFYPFMIGIAYLLPQSIIFSTWFFYLVGKAQLILGAQTGWSDVSPDYPYFGMQAAGAVGGGNEPGNWRRGKILTRPFRVPPE